MILKILFSVSLAIMIIITIIFVATMDRTADTQEPSSDQELSATDPDESEDSPEPENNNIPSPDTTYFSFPTESMTRFEITTDFIDVDIPEEVNLEGFSNFAIYLHEGFTIEPWMNEPGWYRVSYNQQQNIMIIGQEPQIGVTVEDFVRRRVNLNATEENPGLTYSTPTTEFPYFSIERIRAGGEGNEMQDFYRDNGKGGVFAINIQLFPHEWEEEIGPKLLHSLSTLELLPDR